MPGPCPGRRGPAIPEAVPEVAGGRQAECRGQSTGGWHGGRDTQGRGCVLLVGDQVRSWVGGQQCKQALRWRTGAVGLVGVADGVGVVAAAGRRRAHAPRRKAMRSVLGGTTSKWRKMAAVWPRYCAEWWETCIQTQRRGVSCGVPAVVR